MKLPIYEFLIDDDAESGVKTISLVSAPAMKSDFLVFDEQKSKTKYVFVKKDDKEYKGIVAGLALIPNKLIYRIDEETGEEYNGYFSEETIEKIRNKYHKEVMNLKSVNLEHVETDVVEAYLVESYLLDSQVRVEEALGKGIPESVLGSWFVAFKIEDKEVFQEVLNGEFKGYSVEAFLTRELKAIELSKQNNFKNKTMKMKKNLVERLKERVNKILSEVNFEEMLVPELNILLIWGAVGEEVTKTYTNESGVEVTEPVGQGEFVIEDGRTVVTDEASALVEIRDAVVEPEPVVEPAAPVEEVPVSGSTETIVSDFEKPLNSFLDLSKDGKYSIECVIEAGVIKSATVKSVAQLMSEINLAQSDLDKKLKQLIPNDKAGSYSIMVDVNDKGEYVYGVVSSYTSLKLSTDEKINELTAEIEALKVKLSEPIANPILKDVEGEAKEITAYSNYELVARRRNLPIV